MYNFSLEDDGLVLLLVSGSLMESELSSIVDELAVIVEEGETESLRLLIDTTGTSFTIWQLPYLYRIKRLAQYKSVLGMAIIIVPSVARAFKIKLGLQDYDNFAVFTSRNEGIDFLET